MKDKFKFLVEYGLEKKIKNKWFLIINIVLLVKILLFYKIDDLILYGSHSLDRGVTADLFDVVKDYRVNAFFFADRSVILVDLGF